MTPEDIEFTQRWWRRKLSDPDALYRFLLKLYHTENGGYTDNIDAGYRWAKYDETAYNIFYQTALDEKRHAELLVPVVTARGPLLGAEPEPSFYWEEMDRYVVDLKSCAAVFHLGEKLAANRFRVMKDMPETPEDIRAFLESALPDEVHHARIFGKLAGSEAIATMQAHHDATAKRLMGVTQ